jgi:hypothetical protein
LLKELTVELFKTSLGLMELRIEELLVYLLIKRKLILLLVVRNSANKRLRWCSQSKMADGGSVSIGVSAVSARKKKDFVGIDDIDPVQCGLETYQYKLP